MEKEHKLTWVFYTQSGCLEFPCFPGRWFSRKGLSDKSKKGNLSINICLFVCSFIHLFGHLFIHNNFNNSNNNTLYEQKILFDLHRNALKHFTCGACVSHDNIWWQSWSCGVCLSWWMNFMAYLLISGCIATD